MVPLYGVIYYTNYSKWGSLWLKMFLYIIGYPLHFKKKPNKASFVLKLDKLAHVK